MLSSVDQKGGAQIARIFRRVRPGDSQHLDVATFERLPDHRSGGQVGIVEGQLVQMVIDVLIALVVVEPAQIVLRATRGDVQIHQLLHILDQNLERNAGLFERLELVGRNPHVKGSDSRPGARCNPRQVPKKTKVRRSQSRRRALADDEHAWLFPPVGEAAIHALRPRIQ